MRRRQFLSLLAGATVARPHSATAQQAGKLKRIGFLRVGAPPESFIEGFREGLREFGLVEGQNVVIEYGLARSLAQLPDAAAALARLPVDVILASGSPSVMVARNAAGAVPVVFVGGIDPFAVGVAISLARPGGNVTGVTAMHAGLMGKRLQLLKELLPELSRVMVLSDETSPATAEFVKEAQVAAQALGIELKVMSASNLAEMEAAFASAQDAQALLVLAAAIFTADRARLAELALEHRLPSMLGFAELVWAGGLMSYGPHYRDLYRRAASHVHKILQGAKPADLPIEQPTRFEFVVNMKTARALGLTVPAIILHRADEVIE